MTTEHLDIDEDSLDKLLGGAGKAARQDNDAELEKDVVGIDAQITNIAYGASALIQRKQDRKQTLQEEIAERQRQREQIASRAQRMLSTFDEPAPSTPPADPEPPVPPAPVVVEPVTPDPVTPPPAPEPEAEPVVDEDEEDDFLNGLYTYDELQDMTNEELQLLYESYGSLIVVTDHNRALVIGRIISAQRRWCRENDVEDPNEPERTQVTRVFEHIDVRRWNWVQWICAVVLGLIALRIAVQTNNWPDYIENSTPEFFFELLWVVSVTALGFFAGGWIGSLVDARLNRSRSRRSEEE